MFELVARTGGEGKTRRAPEPNGAGRTASGQHFLFDRWTHHPRREDTFFRSARDEAVA
jgi:hypothetical protein